MVATHEVGLGLLNNVPVLLQVVDLVAVRRREIGAHASVVSSDNDTTTAGGLLFVIEVVGGQASLLVGSQKSLSILVVADTSKVDNRVGWEDVLDHSASVWSSPQNCRPPHMYLGTSGRVLGRTTSDELSIAVLDKLFVQACVLVLGQDGIVGLQAILLKQGLVSDVAVSTCFRNPLAAIETCPLPWISRRGFSRQRRS